VDQADLNTYTSGRGKESIVPPEIRRWNWGAFFLTWIWGIGNRTYLALLTNIPPLTLVMPFVLGAKGSEWAWRNRFWRDVEHFKATQRRWAWAGSIVFIVLAFTCIAIPLTFMRQSEAFRLSLKEVQRHREIGSLLGEPIEPGLLVTGSVFTSGPNSEAGEADLHYSVRGGRAKGEVSVYALKRAGSWKLQQVVVEIPNAGRRVSVVPSGRGPRISIQTLPADSRLRRLHAEAPER